MGFEWIALILGMCLNYVGLYYLVPTAADQPILIIINMEKPQKKKVDDVIMDVVVKKNDHHKMYNQSNVKARTYIENDSGCDADKDDESKNEHFGDVAVKMEEVAPLLQQQQHSSCSVPKSSSVSTNYWWRALFV